MFRVNSSFPIACYSMSVPLYQGIKVRLSNQSELMTFQEMHYMNKGIQLSLSLHKIPIGLGWVGLGWVWCRAYFQHDRALAFRDRLRIFEF